VVSSVYVGVHDPDAIHDAVPTVELLDKEAATEAVPVDDRDIVWTLLSDRDAVADAGFTEIDRETDLERSPVGEREDV
jgi:hypothetical protein